MAGAKPNNLRTSSACTKFEEGHRRLTDAWLDPIKAYLASDG